MKKCLSILLVLVLLFGVGGVSAFAQDIPDFSELGPVVLSAAAVILVLVVIGLFFYIR